MTSEGTRPEPQLACILSKLRTEPRISIRPAIAPRTDLLISIARILCTNTNAFGIEQVVGMEQHSFGFQFKGIVQIKEDLVAVYSP